MKKGCLKKCRNCNHKKRSCLELRSNCNAFQRSCFGCKKIGHFPRSLNCKKTRNIKKSKNHQLKKKVIKSELLKQKSANRVSPQVLNLINERIHQLETAMEGHSSLDSNSSTKEDEIVPSETIPFLMMFIFLNYEVIFKSISLEAGRNLSEFN